MICKYHVELSAAINAVRAASRVCKAVQSRLINPETIEKKDKSPVTVADFASQAVVCAKLAEVFPDDGVVGEEDAAELRGNDAKAVRDVVVSQVLAELSIDNTDAMSDDDVLAFIDRGGAEGIGSRYWTVDPIDGTKGFLRGEQYAVALALIVDGKVVLGVLGCPNLPLRDGEEPGALFAAVRGEGATIRSLWEVDDAGESIRVSDVTSPTKAKFCESVESGHSDQGASSEIAKTLGITTEPFRIDSQCKYAAVARADASIYLRLPTRVGYEEKIWDHAAGMIVVEEAGGRVTDIDGKDLDFSLGQTLKGNRGIIATCGPFHNDVVAAVTPHFS